MDFIIVTNWEKVEADDFYLSEEWDEENKDRAIELQKENELYIAYIVPALDYLNYHQMNSEQVFVGDSCEVVMHCETAVIEDQHNHRETYIQA